MKRTINVVVPTPGLDDALKDYPEMVLALGPYLEAIAAGDFMGFYDNMVDYLPDAGDLEDVSSNKTTRIIENFDLLIDEVHSAITHIKLPDVNILLPVKDYTVLNTKRYGQQEAVVLTMISKKEID